MKQIDKRPFLIISARAALAIEWIFIVCNGLEGVWAILLYLLVRRTSTKAPVRRPTIDLPSVVRRKVSTTVANVDDQFMDLKTSSPIETTSLNFGEEVVDPDEKPRLDFDSKTTDQVRMPRVDFDASTPYLKISAVRRLTLEDLSPPTSTTI
ncbi:unnamed protein product, partial [Didymodactylos carnosus]